jgi:transposase
MNFNNHSDFSYGGGVDLHSENFHAHIVDRRNGKKVQSGKRATREADIRKYFEPFRGLGLKVAVEIGTSTFWFCDILNSMGIQTHIVNTLENSMIFNSRKKTDKIDAKTLCHQLCKDILPHPVYKPPHNQRELRQMVSQRSQYVRSRSQTINRAHSLLKNHGIMERKRDLRSHKTRLELLARLTHMSNTFMRRLNTYFRTIESLSGEIKNLEDEMYGHLKTYFFTEYRRLVTLPGVALITAASIISMVGDWGRFKNGRKLSSYLGIVPTVYNSAGKMVGSNAITKQGNSLARGYLVQTALGVLKSKSEEAQPLKEWYNAIRIKKGWKKARVSLARKLCCIMFGMMKNGTDYDPSFVTKNSKPAEN